MFRAFNQANVVPPLRLVFLMWIAFTIQSTFSYDLGFLGVYPRTINGLIGVLFAPLIHGNIGHLVSNTLPVLFLGSTLYIFYPKISTRVFSLSYLFTNILVWIFARPFFHIGASGLVYALTFFLIALGLFRRDFKTLAIALVIVIIYGGLVYNIGFLNSAISWESHLLGAISGIGLAYSEVKIRGQSDTSFENNP